VVFRAAGGKRKREGRAACSIPTDGGKIAPREKKGAKSALRIAEGRKKKGDRAL